MAQQVAIDLDRRRYFHFNLNILCDLEADMGEKALWDVFSQNELNLRRVRQVIYRGLANDAEKRGELDFSPERAAELIYEHFLMHGNTLADLMELVMEALKDSGLMPREKKPDTPSTETSSSQPSQPSSSTDVQGPPAAAA